jgi:hypothetical protein
MRYLMALAVLLLTAAPASSLGVDLYNPGNTQSPCWVRWNGDGHPHLYQMDLARQRWCEQRMWAQGGKHGAG